MRHLYLLTVFFLLLGANSLRAQEWQALYNAALQSYNNEDYSNALSTAIKAYNQVKGKDAKST
ncbi:MAG: hypothetical protein O9262_05525, partial [Cyclobacteriaceae bacterium]|nr:hypothetical protein [Cyclobacteriaceae bacterium]